jgi:hypothetical protein
VRIWIYPLVCLVVPQLWAVVAARAFARRERPREMAARARAAAAPRDFSI